MLKKKRIILIVAAALIVVFAGWAASEIYGLPWKERAVAEKLETYLEKKYDQEFTLKKSFYNFKDGSYGGYFYPRTDPQFEFYAEEGFAEYVYVDNYPEVLWAHQLKEAVLPIAKEVFPEVASVDTNYVTYESLDIVKGPDIPSFDEAGAMLSVRFELKNDFLESDWKRLAALVKKVQHLSPAVDAAFNFINVEQGFETFIFCPPKTEDKIESVQGAKKSCSVDRYEMENEEE